MESNFIRLGVIGCGGIAQHAHLPSIARVETETLVAVADEFLEVAQKVGSMNGLDKKDAYGDYRYLLEREDIDAVVICTLTESHPEICIEALRAGKHVLLEKPMAINVDEAKTMAAEAEKAGRILMVAYNHSYDIASAYVKNMIVTGELGEIIYAEVFFYEDAGAWDAGAYRSRIRSKDYKGWKKAANMREALLNYVHNFDSHVINLMRMLIGEPVALEYCSYLPGAGLWTVFDYQGFKVMMKNVESKQRRFEKGIEICGRKKRVRVNLAPPLQRYSPASLVITDMESQTEYTPLLEYRWPFELEHEHFAACVLKGKEPMTSGAFSINDVRIVASIVDMAMKK